jgi:hypothetical protein
VPAIQGFLPNGGRGFGVAPDTTQAKIRAAVERLAQPYRTADGLVLPVAFKIAAGVRR